MNIRTALEKRIPRLRKPEWANPGAYLRLPLLADGSYGGWAELYDDRNQIFMDIKPGEQRLLVHMMMDDEGFEVYSGPVSEHEKDNFAKGYSEA